MSLKKKLGVKLAQGVRQVQSQSESASDAPTKSADETNRSTQATPNGSSATDSTSMNELHPKRVWPD